MVKRLLVPALLLGLLPGRAMAQSLWSAAPIQTPTPAPSQAMVDWQHQYDAAKRQKSGAKKKMLLGIVGASAGLSIGLLATDNCLASVDFDCTGSTHAATFGLIAAIAGGGVFVWGAFEYQDANAEISRLDAQRPKGSAIAVPLGEHQRLSLTLGHDTALAYQVSWR